MEEALSGVKRTLYCGELREEHIGQRVTIMGWVQKQRNKGSLIFLDIRDRKGVVQADLRRPAVSAVSMWLLSQGL